MAAPTIEEETEEQIVEGSNREGKQLQRSWSYQKQPHSDTTITPGMNNSTHELIFVKVSHTLIQLEVTFSFIFQEVQMTFYSPMTLHISPK
jgi:hypothetical protein